MAGTTGILGAQVPVATGVSPWQLKAGGRACVCLFGDGAANRGDCHEGMNMAALYKAPIVFICESNGVAESQHWDSYMPIADLSVRARASYGMPGLRVDGNDAFAMHRQHASRALARARVGEGPTFIVADTCRLHPHVEGLPDFREPGDYLKYWKDRDPLQALSSRLLPRSMDEAAMAALEQEVGQEIQAGLAAALALPVLDAARLAECVYMDRKGALIMAEARYRAALRDALLEEMQRDERVIMIGQDIGRLGGSFAVSKGLLDQFGPQRIIETPISESAIVGTAVGMAMMGMRPVAELMFADFLTLGMDQLVNGAAKAIFSSGGTQALPMVVRAPYGATAPACITTRAPRPGWPMSRV